MAINHLEADQAAAKILHDNECPWLPSHCPWEQSTWDDPNEHRQVYLGKAISARETGAGTYPSRTNTPIASNGD